MRVIMFTPPPYPGEQLSLFLSHCGVIAQIEPSLPDFGSQLFRDPSAIGLSTFGDDDAAAVALDDARFGQIINPILILLDAEHETFSAKAARLLWRGADDVQPVRIDFSELIERLRALARRRRRDNAERIHDLSGCLYAPDRHLLIGKAGSVALSGLESTLMAFLFERRGRTISKPTFMDVLYSGPDEQPNEKIIDVVVCKLRRKIASAGGDPLAIATVWGQGFRAEHPATVEGAA